MLGINLDVAQHHLNILSKAEPMNQRPHRFTLECQQVISDEVDKLTGVRLITKVQYSQYLLNITLVKITNGNKRICINYIDLNKVHLKDSYSLPRIN